MIPKQNTLTLQHTGHFKLKIRCVWQSNGETEEYNNS